MRMVSWSFLTNHARVLLCIARDPGARLRDIAASVGITERSAHAIVTDLAAAGYVVKQKDGRRNRYQIQAHLPLPGAGHRGTSPSAKSSLSSPARDPRHRTARPRDPSRQGAGRQLRPRWFAGTRDERKSDPPARTVIQRP